MNFLNGYKTYITAALSALTAILSYLNGNTSFSTAIHQVPGLFLFLALGLASLRHAVAKVEAKLPTPVQQVVAPVMQTLENRVQQAVAPQVVVGPQAPIAPVTPAAPTSLPNQP